MSKNIEHNRRDYSRGEELRRSSLLNDPIDQFKLWFEQALEAELGDPTAMTVATVSPDGQPSQRIVLLKHVDQDGFVFYTNLESRKAQELSHNGKISLHFPWHAMDRQVKICGTADKVSVAQALRYFSSRPKESRLAAWASAQSRVLNSRQVLLQQFNKMKERFAKGEIPLPDFWGGYRVVPHEIEFWQGRENRLHDRFVYYKNTGGQSWSIERLGP